MTIASIGLMFQLTARNVRSSPDPPRRVSEHPANDPEFGKDELARRGLVRPGGDPLWRPRGHRPRRRQSGRSVRPAEPLTALARRAIAKASALRSTKGDTTGGPQWQKLLPEHHVKQGAA